MYIYIERLGFDERDNYIDYLCGPFIIKVSPYEEKIIISTTSKKWESHIPKIIKVVKEAWEVEDSQIVIENIITIKYNLNNLNLYLSTLIKYV